MHQSISLLSIIQNISSPHDCLRDVAIERAIWIYNLQNTWTKPINMIQSSEMPSRVKVIVAFVKCANKEMFLLNTACNSTWFNHTKKNQPQRPWLWQSSWQSYWQSFITSKALIMALAKTSASSLLLKFRPYTCLLSRHCKYRIMYYKYIFWHIENTLACCLTTANTLMMNCLNINWNIENK